MTSKYANKYHRYGLNDQGRDFIIGDLHGWKSILDALLEKVKFDATVDRLFSVGDLADRGPDSYGSITDDRIISVLGNHEIMLLEAEESRHDPYGSSYAADMFTVNGGAWYSELDETQKLKVLKKIKTKPYAIEIETVLGKVGIIHAFIKDWDHVVEVFDHGLDEETDKSTIVGKTISEKVESMVLWSRSSLTEPVKNIDFVVVGHTPINRASANFNMINLDTGAFAGNVLSMMEISERPVVHTLNQKLTEYNKYPVNGLNFYISMIKNA